MQVPNMRQKFLFHLEVLKFQNLLMFVKNQTIIEVVIGKKKNNTPYVWVIFDGRAWEGD